LHFIVSVDLCSATHSATPIRGASSERLTETKAVFKQWKNTKRLKTKSRSRETMVP